jgi:hypothetical protein
MHQTWLWSLSVISSCISSSCLYNSFFLLNLSFNLFCSHYDTSLDFILQSKKLIDRLFLVLGGEV